MSINWRYVAGITTIAGVLGLTTYSIILYKRQQKEEEESMSVDEARDLLNESQDEAVREMSMEDADMLEKAVQGLKEAEHFSHVMDGISKIEAKHIKEVEAENEQEDLDQMEEELREEEIEPEGILLEDEGDGKLRYDPNSDEALLQYMRMELAEWAPHEETHKTLLHMFDVMFEPHIDGDVILHSKLLDYRAEFFGPSSRWTQRVSYTDLILHFAKLADYNLGGGVRYWGTYFLEHNSISVHDMSDDHIDYVVGLMNDHDWVRSDGNTWGLFGLEKDEFENVNEIARRNLDRSLTYEIEFNEFLKGSDRRGF